MRGRSENIGLHCVTPEEFPQYGNVAVIFMLDDPRKAMTQLSPYIGAINCIAYNDLVLDEVVDSSRDPKWFKSEWENIRKGFSLMESLESKRIYVNVLCNRIAPQFSTQSDEDLCVQPQYFYKNEGYRILGFSYKVGI